MVADTELTQDVDAEVRIGSKEEAFWEKQLKASERIIEQCENEIKLQGEVVAICEAKIAEEQKSNE